MEHFKGNSIIFNWNFYSMHFKASIPESHVTLQRYAVLIL